MNGVCITSEDHNVEVLNVGCIGHIQMPFGCEKGSLIINIEQSHTAPLETKKLKKNITKNGCNSA